MAAASTTTTEKLKTPEVKQYSIFLHNRVGALMEIVKLLGEHSVLVLALSIVESSETAIARVIVSDPERVELLFNEHEIAFNVCEVLVIELREGANDLVKVLAALLKAEVNIHFSYPLLVRPRGRAVLAILPDDVECATSVLQGDGFRLLAQGDLSR